MAASRSASKQNATRKVSRRREPAAGAPALLGLTSDWYWEQDAELRFTRVEVRNDDAAEQERAQRLLGKMRGETGIEIEGGWDAHRAMLEARAPFRDVLMWRTFPDGARRYVSVSGEPVFDAKGRFLGYRGIGRDVSKQKRIQQLLKLDHAVTRRVAAVLQFTSRRMRQPDKRLWQTLGAIGTQIGQFLGRAEAERAVRESEARFRALTNLSTDWYWELDAQYRFTRLEGRNVAGGGPR